jgi:hypothetical protein
MARSRPSSCCACWRCSTSGSRSLSAAATIGELVPHERLLDRFRAAVDELDGDARAEDLPKYVKNLHRVERDMVGVDETEIELPTWI